MKLRIEQIAFYHENKHIQIEKYLSDKEVEIIYPELPCIIEKILPNNMVRSIFAPHFVNDTYKRLSRLKRFVMLLNS